MDMVRALEASVGAAGGRPLPVAWRGDSRFEGVGSVDGLLSAVRACDDRSDRLLEALVDLGPDDPTAPVVVLAALLRLRAGRCGRSPERLDALASELAVVLAEAWRGELPRPPERRLANVMADRAWGRVRTAERRGRWMEQVPLDVTGPECASSWMSPEEATVAPVTVSQFRARVATARGPRERQLVRAWNAAVELWDVDRETVAERNRWQYAKRVLRRHVSPDLELLDM
jgi:hypothetical protein